jgi:hypothetical protein
MKNVKKFRQLMQDDDARSIFNIPICRKKLGCISSLKAELTGEK